MIDVDVSSPGVWDRASDVLFEDLKRREIEEESAGIVNNDPNRPRSKGGRLTEQNLKLWLSIVCLHFSLDLISYLTCSTRIHGNPHRSNRLSIHISGLKENYLRPKHSLMHAQCRRLKCWIIVCEMPTPASVCPHTLPEV
jgi:hypothetical protein